MYRVIKAFVDLQDNNHKYKVSTSRIKELSTDKNRRGVPLIEKAEDPKE